MSMPYTIEYFEGNRRETTPPRPMNLPKDEEWPRTFECDRLPFKVYPSGPKVRATAEEVQVWEHVQELAQKVSDLAAAANSKEIEGMQAAGQAPAVQAPVPAQEKPKAGRR